MVGEAPPRCVEREDPKSVVKVSRGIALKEERCCGGQSATEVGNTTRKKYATPKRKNLWKRSKQQCQSQAPKQLSTQRGRRIHVLSSDSVFESPAVL